MALYGLVSDLLERFGRGHPLCLFSGFGECHPFRVERADMRFEPRIHGRATLVFTQILDGRMLIRHRCCQTIRSVFHRVKVYQAASLTPVMF